jgi:site-specific recombinase XerD
VGIITEIPPIIPTYGGLQKEMKMKQSTVNQWTIVNSQDTHLLTWVEAFLFDRKAQGLSKGTLYFYQKKLQLFTAFCESQVVQHITEITPSFLREYLVYLEQRGHNPGGIHACYRALKTFLLWWEGEVEPEGWKNPIRKVKAPRKIIKPIKPVSLNAIQALLDTCDNSRIGRRDKAILLTLLDTGVRASELCAMNWEDTDTVYGSILIPKSKGKKPRTVFLGKKSRRAIRAYLRTRNDHSPALWVTISGNRLSYWGLRQIIRRRATKVNVNVPGLHDFRRAFALQSLRNGMDIYSLQKLMGHADLQVLQRYLAQTTEDIQNAHRLGSPVDNSGL